MSEYRNITIHDDFLTTSPLTPLSELWHKDDDHPSCELCNKKFTLVKRRHHCRNCGKIICFDCLMYQYTKTNQKVPFIVCKLCKYCVFSHEGKESNDCVQYMYDAKLVDGSLSDSDPEGGGYKHRKNKSKRKNKRSLRRRRTSKRSNIRRKNKNKKVTKRMRKSRRHARR
jgi:hypothetical protein